MTLEFIRCTCGKETIAFDTIAFTKSLLYSVEMPPRDNLGEFEQLVLLAVFRLKADAYGMRVRQEIETRTNRPTSIGAVYATLDRMESKGLLRSEVGESTPTRGGRPKKIFALTALGSDSLRRSMEALSKMRHGIKMGELEWLV